MEPCLIEMARSMRLLGECGRELVGRLETASPWRGVGVPYAVGKGPKEESSLGSSPSFRWIAGLLPRDQPMFHHGGTEDTEDTEEMEKVAWASAQVFAGSAG